LSWSRGRNKRVPRKDQKCSVATGKFGEDPAEAAIEFQRWIQAVEREPIELEPHLSDIGIGPDCLSRLQE
jgi:hypothetical protein